MRGEWRSGKTPPRPLPSLVFLWAEKTEESQPGAPESRGWVQFLQAFIHSQGPNLLGPAASGDAFQEQKFTQHPPWKENLSQQLERPHPTPIVVAPWLGGWSRGAPLPTLGKTFWERLRMGSSS